MLGVGVSGIRSRVVALLKQGTTPHTIALSMAVGALIGVFPVLGTTTVACLGVALLFRLNVVALQILNYAVYPLQLALLIPFVRLGERLTGAKPVALALPQMMELFRAGLVHAMAEVGRSLLRASAAWLVVAPLAIPLLYLILLPLVRRAGALYAATRAKPAAL